jgi:hypothetical protein
MLALLPGPLAVLGFLACQPWFRHLPWPAQAACVPVAVVAGIAAADVAAGVLLLARKGR